MMNFVSIPITFISFLSILFFVSVSASASSDRSLLTSHNVPTLLDAATSFDHDQNGLSNSLYHKSCPDVEGIIHKKVKEWVKKDPTLAPSLIRLHFHDCVVRGCDASILLNHSGSERSTNESKSLRGFQVIDDIKAELEKKCPRTVSCADILTTVARDATILAGGPFWSIPFGRKDGRISLAKEAANVPMGRESVTKLIELFRSKGLNVLDLVVLSGAHTIGRSTCESVQHRLYNYNGTKKADPSVNPQYLNYLRKNCRSTSGIVSLDATTPKTFDIQYYRNLKKKMGLLSTDQFLNIDSRTKPFVDALYTETSLFLNQFSVSMVKLANILDAKSQEKGEIRINCNRVN